MKRLYTFIAAALAVSAASAAAISGTTEKSLSDNLQVNRAVLSKTAVPTSSGCIDFSSKISKARKTPKSVKALKAPTTAQEAFGIYQFQSQGILGEQQDLSLFVSQAFTVVRPEKEGNQVTVENFLLEGYNVTGTFDATSQTITIPSGQEGTAKVPIVTLKDTLDYQGRPTKIDVFTYKDLPCSILPLDTASILQDSLVLHLDSNERTLTWAEVSPVPNQPGYYSFDQFLYITGGLPKTATDSLEVYGLMRLADGNEINADMSYSTIEDILNPDTENEKVIWDDHHIGVYAETNEDQSKLTVTNLYGNYGGIFNGQLFDTYELDINLKEGTATLTDALVYSSGTLQMYLWGPDEKGYPYDSVCKYKIANATDKLTGQTFGVLYDDLAVALAASKTQIYNWLYAGQIILPFTWNFDGAGIEGVTVADENAPVEYFNLQGVRVANPEKGLYIKRQGKTVTKVLVK